MSRIGRIPVAIPKGVKRNFDETVPQRYDYQG